MLSATLRMSLWLLTSSMSSSGSIPARSRWPSSRLGPSLPTPSVEAARSAVQQAASSIKEAESNLTMNRAEYKRQEELLPRKATSQKAYQQAEANYRVSVQQRATAIAGLAQAKANLHKAEANLAEAKANRGAADEENPFQEADAEARVRELEARLRE